MLLITPFFFQERVKVKFDPGDFFIGIIVSFIVLLPFSCFLVFAGRPFVMLPPSAVIFQLFGAAVPEEVYFRGFLQERLGNTLISVVIVSILFSLMHVPRVIFYGDVYSPLTFFPSLVMGFLYLRTSNVVPPTIFHVAANTVFLSFRTTLH